MNPYPCLLPMRLRTPPRRVAPVRSDARGLVWEDEYKAYITRVDGEAKTLDTATGQAAAGISPDFVQSWKTFYASWRSYFDAHKDPHATATKIVFPVVNFVPVSTSELDDWAQKIKDWDASLRKESNGSGGSPGPGPLGPQSPPDRSSVLPGIGKAATGLAALALALGGLYLVLK